MKRIFNKNHKSTKQIFGILCNVSSHQSPSHSISCISKYHMQHIAIKKKLIAPVATKTHKSHIEPVKSIKGEHYTDAYCNVCKVSFPSSYQAQEHVVSKKHAKKMLEYYSDEPSKQKRITAQSPLKSDSTSNYSTDPKQLIHVKGVKGKHYTSTYCHVCDVSFDENNACNLSQHLNGRKHIKNVLALYSGEYHDKCIYCNASCSTAELKHSHFSSSNHSNFINLMVEEASSKYLESEWVLSLGKCQEKIGGTVVAKKTSNAIQTTSAARIRKAIRDCYDDDSVASVDSQLLLLQKLYLRSDGGLTQKDYVSILFCVSSLMRTNDSDIIGDGMIKICKLFADDMDTLQESKWKMNHKLFEEIIDMLLLSANLQHIMHQFDELNEWQNTRKTLNDLLGIEAEKKFLFPFTFLFAFFNDKSKWKSDCFESENAHKYFMKWTQLIFQDMMYDLRDIGYIQQTDFYQHYKHMMGKYHGDVHDASDLIAHCSFTETKRMDYGPCTNIIMSTLSPFILCSLSKGSFALLVPQDIDTNTIDIKQVVVGYIYKMSATSQTLTVRIANHSNKIAANCRWHILCMGASAASFESQFAALQAITSGSVCSQLGSILYGDGLVEKSMNIKPLINSQLLSQLNASQRAAVEAAMRNNITLIQGPPGSGKTHVAAAIVEQFLQQQSFSKLLLSAYSNIAVDVLTERVSAAGSNPLRIGSDSTLTDCALLLNAYPFYEWTQKVNGTKIICATSIGTGNDMLKNTQFDLILIDETTQSTESGLLVALSKLAQNGKIILIGDHKQLPPTVCSMYSKANGLDISLFQRLINDKNIEPHFLDTQYRMHPILAQFPSMYFYDGHLLSGITASDRSSPPGFDWPTKGFPIAFVQTGDEAKEAQSFTSTINEQEAQIVIDIVTKLVRKQEEQKVTVIAPYVAQKKLIQKTLDEMLQYEERKRVKVRTVDGFQGSECDVIVFSATRSNDDSTIGFLRDYRRVNVMLTRCKNGLIVVGDRSTLSNGDPLWRNWMQYVCDANGAVIKHYQC